MVKLDIVDEETAEFLEVATVVGVEESGIKSGDGFVELLLILDFIERRDGLSAGAKGEQHEGQQEQPEFEWIAIGYHRSSLSDRSSARDTGTTVGKFLYVRAARGTKQEANSSLRLPAAGRLGMTAFVQVNAWSDSRL